MNVQRKTIISGLQSLSATEIALEILTKRFDDAPSVNIHGLQITMGMSPFGPDETLIGRWYVILLPPSVAKDATIRAEWIENLNTISSSNEHLDASEFVWGAGSILCAEQSVFNLTFAPKTSRNAPIGSRLIVVMVADRVSGVVDNWDGVATMSMFTSS